MSSGACERSSRRRSSARDVVAELLFIIAVMLCSHISPAQAFAPQPMAPSITSRSTLFDTAMERGEMILASDSDRLLNVAFSSLNDKDKYETVLTGLCAKIIDGGEANAKEGLVDPMRLMEEMNSSGITAGPRGVIGLIDVSMGITFYPHIFYWVEVPPSLKT